MMMVPDNVKEEYCVETVNLGLIFFIFMIITEFLVCYNYKIFINSYIVCNRSKLCIRIRTLEIGDMALVYVICAIHYSKKRADSFNL